MMELRAAMQPLAKLRLVSNVIPTQPVRDCLEVTANKVQSTQLETVA
jgi:hypothetical protein